MQRFRNHTKDFLNLQKHFTKPVNNCTYFTVVGTGYSFKLCTFKSLIHILLGVVLKIRIVILLHKKLQILSLQ